MYEMFDKGFGKFIALFIETIFICDGTINGYWEVGMNINATYNLIAVINFDAIQLLHSSWCAQCRI